VLGFAGDLLSGDRVAEALDGVLTPNGCKKVYRRETGESGGRVHKAKEAA
jgi:hypothetical protein